MKHVSVELTLKGQVIRGVDPLDSLILVREHLEANRRCWDEDFIAIPFGISQLIPAGVLSWAAFFQKVHSPDLAARRIFAAIDFDLPPASSPEGVFAAWMDRICADAYLWQKDHGCMLQALRGLNHQLSAVADFKRMAA